MLDKISGFQLFFTRTHFRYSNKIVWKSLSQLIERTKGDILCREQRGIYYACFLHEYGNTLYVAALILHAFFKDSCCNQMLSVLNYLKFHMLELLLVAYILGKSLAIANCIICYWIRNKCYSRKSTRASGVSLLTTSLSCVRLIPPFFILEHKEVFCVMIKTLA